jgi:pyruvate dehydrogenase E2 component (dihydrolipoamide acetyltransferase)
VEVVVPDLGDFSDVEVVEVLVKAGDQVSAEDPLITLETDKATLDVPSPAAGVVKELKVSAGDRVSSGDPVLLLDAADDEDTEQDDADADDDAKKDADGDTDGDADDEGGAKRDAGGAHDEPADDDTGAETAAEADDSQGQAEGELRTVTVPDLGDFSDVEIVELLVGEGDEVTAEQGLIALETEKAMVEVPAPVAGTVVELKVGAGDRVSTGDEVAVIRGAAGKKTDKPAAKEKEKAGAKDAGAGRTEAGKSSAQKASGGKAGAAASRSRRAGALPPVNEAGFARAHASPSVRKLARELGVDLGSVDGSGRKGRVTADDIKAFVRAILEDGTAGAALPAVPVVDFARFGEIELEPLSRVQKISGPRLHASWVNVPHVTHHEEADITELEERRQALKDDASERGIRLTPLAFIIRACVLVLDEFPRFKASLSADGESLVMKRYVHIGFAADTPKGLMVPVIRDADKKDVYELAKSLASLSESAREGRLGPNDMQGGVFTVSSLGGIGGTAFTPIINAPEVAILGVSRHQWRPVYHDGSFVPRLMLPLSLSYDHRVIDGAEAARFAAALAKALGDPTRLLEAIP